MKHIFFILVLVFHYALAFPKIDIESCTEDGDIPTPLSFTSEGCVKPPCPLYKDTTSNGNITFKIPQDTDVATVEIKAQVAGMWVPFTPPDTNVCHNLLNSYCPLDKEEIVIFNMAIKVLKFYPSIRLTLKVKILDEKNQTISCMKVECQVLNSPKLITN